MGTYKVFPSIGVARLGNSTEADNYYYIAPETSGGLPILPDGGIFTENDFRDSAGNMKRQGARFRVYYFPEAGEGGDPYEVLLDGDTSITWTVHLANKKSVWYEFSTMLGEGEYPPTTDLRNLQVTSNRETLITDPGPRTLTGPDQSAEFSRTSDSSGYAMTFPPEGLQPFPIDTLGEIRTDSDGRLIVIGALGNSGTDQTYPLPEPEDLDYVNNNHWWDDTADGPVSATVTVNGQTYEAEPGWVVSVPPAYAPEILAQISMYDVMYDVAVRYLGAGDPNDIDGDMTKLLNRAFDYKWLTSDEPGCHRSLTSQHISYMRSPDEANEPPQKKMPTLAGDRSISPNLDSKYVTFPQAHIDLGYRWEVGDYPEPTEPTEWDLLTRAALDNCSGAAFAPGIEMTWFSRRSEIYAEAFRLKHRSYSYPLSTDATPLTEGLEPGDFIKYMAIPWQADFNECSVQWIDGPDVHWWPAQRPLMVYDQDSGVKRPWIGDDNADPDNANYLRFNKNTDMVEDWDKLGFVFNVGTAETPDFVEVQRTLVEANEEEKRKSRPTKYEFRSGKGKGRKTR
ncbi:MAG: hypothetical protein F6K41_18345 [Symploca sp. SIO3E6]|nr:hypothetical protein [Caldora sp. SIO3E6]